MSDTQPAVDMEVLQDRWAATLAHYHVPKEKALAVWADVVAAYAGPRRHYHNLRHVQRMLAVVDELGHLATDPAAVALAVWMHDLVYDPQRDDNEERSAERAGVLLRALGLDPVTISRVQALVLATKTHQAGDDPDAAVLIDADLAGLAASWEEFQEGGLEIAQECTHLPAAAYRAARARVLRSFLERPQIYQTETMRRCCEKAARRNLARAIADLEASQPDSQRGGQHATHCG